MKTEIDYSKKNLAIKQTYFETTQRRKSQVCKVYTVKIQENALKPKQFEQLKMMFVEAKWMYNDILSKSNEESIYTYSYKTNEVSVLNKERIPEVRQIQYLGSQMKQSVLDEIYSNVKSLFKLKKNGNKIGKLKFISEFKSINLKQYGNTYQINENKIKIQKVSGWLKVNGLKQLDETMEITNAKLINKPSGIYLAITVFINKDKIKKQNKINKDIGIDMGCSTTLTLSSGDKIDVSVSETERLKFLQRKLARQVKGSNNRRKTIKLIQKEYEKMSNRKNDKANKICNKLLQYQNVYIQDENLVGWKSSGFKGNQRKIQHSILGRVKSKLIKQPNVTVINRFVATTKLCNVCHQRNEEIKLSDRTFVCPHCGHTDDRDINAAKNMILVGREPAKFKPVKLKKSTLKQEDCTL